jgi:iron transport multicopper oxidase
VPVLLQILSGAQSATDLLPTGSVFTLPANSVVELSIPGGTPGAPHPFHLHGVRCLADFILCTSVLTSTQHNFFVIKSAGNDTYNFDNPVRCATIRGSVIYVGLFRLFEMLLTRVQIPRMFRS